MPLSNHTRLGPYEGLLREVILRLKSWHGEGLAEVVGKLWADHAQETLRAEKPDVVIPVPLHWRKHWQRGYNQSQALARMLARLDQATEPRHLDLPGWRLHPLKGDLAGYWSITVSANWRIVFRFEQGDAADVDLLDYH